MSSASIKVKAYLKDGGVQDIRRFSLTLQDNNSYDQLKDKIQETFKQINDRSYTVTYTDNEGDDVVINSEEEFKLSLEEYNKGGDGVYKIKIHITPEKRPDNSKKCNSCSESITGGHYKCLECPEYYVCVPCETQQHHHHHSMIYRIHQQPFGPWISMFQDFMSNCGQTQRQEGQQQSTSQGSQEQWQGNQQHQEKQHQSQGTQQENQENQQQDQGNQQQSQGNQQSNKRTSNRDPMNEFLGSLFGTSGNPPPEQLLNTLITAGQQIAAAFTANQPDTATRTGCN